jgi:ABC-type polysaccharide/polyol phosphate export permease
MKVHDMSAETLVEPPVYDSSDQRMWLLREVRELFAYRSLIRLLVVSQLKQRYRRSMLGIIWALIGPLINTIVLSIAFTSLFRSSINQYPVYVLVGLVGWNFFSQTSIQGIDAAVSGSGLLQRVYLPRSVFIISAIGGGLNNLGFALIALLIVIVFTGAPFYITWLLLPFAIALLAIFTMGITLLLSAIAVFIGDIAHMYQLVIQALFFLTPIVYPRDIMPTQYAWIFRLNPLTELIDIFRALLYRGEIPALGVWVNTLALALVTLVVGYTLFTWRSDEGVYFQ